MPKSAIPNRLEQPTRVLALDLGMETGWAMYLDGSVISGYHANRRSPHDSAGMVFLNFRAFLRKLHDRSGGFDCVYYEAVYRHMGTHAAHIYGGLWAMVTAFCQENGIPFEGIAVQHIKKHATGSGNAPKELVLMKVRDRWAPNVKSYDEADAIALLYYALETLEIETPKLIDDNIVDPSETP